MTELRLSYYDRVRLFKDDEDVIITIEFESVSKIRRFINNEERVFKILMKDNSVMPYGSIYTFFEIVKIHKIKNQKMEATVKKTDIKNIKSLIRNSKIDKILEAS